MRIPEKTQVADPATLAALQAFVQKISTRSDFSSAILFGSRARHSHHTESDADGACNRAYYAMFDAARAALMEFQESDEVLTIKTHSGLISSFSLQLVKPGLIDIELGKALNKVEDLRMIADYKGDAIAMGDSAWAVEQAAAFLESVRTAFFKNEN